MNIKNRLRTVGAAGGAVLALALAVSLPGCAGVSYVGGSSGAEVVGIAQEYPGLDGYGEWISVAPYGSCWQPYVGPRWAPFMYGNWLYTNAGWLWSSYEPWGNVVYHYGEWNFDTTNGWYWIPGKTWSPARVNWVVYGDYIGWRPMGPSFNKDPGPWVHHDHRIWTLVRYRDFNSDNVGQYDLITRPKMNDRDRRSKAFRPPTPRGMMRKLGHRIRQESVTKEHRVVNHRHETVVRLPQLERAKVERHREEVAKKVVKRPPERPQDQGKGNRGHGNKKGRGKG